MVLLKEAIDFTKNPGSPPWITFLTLFATMWMTRYFVGPPKPGANQAKETAPPTQFQRLKKVATTVIIPWGMLAKFLYTALITLLTAYELAMAESGPLPFGESCSHTGGASSCDSVAAGVFRGLQSLLWLLRGPGFAVGAAGLVSKWGAAYQLMQLYYGHSGSCMPTKGPTSPRRSLQPETRCRRGLRRAALEEVAPRWVHKAPQERLTRLLLGDASEPEQPPDDVTLAALATMRAR